MTVADLIAEFERHDWSLNERTARALAARGDEAMPALKSALHSSDPYVRSGAAQTLRLLPYREAYDDLVVALHDAAPGPSPAGEVSEARHHAALALAAIGEQRACPELLRALSDCLAADLSVAWYIIDALAALRCPTAIPALERLVDHRDVDVRKASLSALAVLRRNGEPGDA